MPLEVSVDHILQLFAGLEERNLFGGNLDAVASFGVAPDAGFALAGAEAAETTDLDLVARAQRAHDAFKDRLDDDLAVFTGQFRQPGHLIDQVCLGHFARPFSPSQTCTRECVQRILSDSAQDWQV